MTQGWVEFFTRPNTFAPSCCDPTGTTLADARRETRRARFDGKELDCPVYQRERLDVGLELAGPAILDQLDCTTVICPGQVARVDEWKNLIVTSHTS